MQSNLPRPSAPQARTDNVLVQEAGDEIVLYDETTDEAHLLNPTTALVWNHSDGETSVAALAALLAEELEAPADETLVEAALLELEDAGLMDTPLEGKADPGSPEGVSRRAALRKMVAAGAMAAVLMPAVRSITAPTPAMAASPGDGGGGAPPDPPERPDPVGTSTNSHSDSWSWWRWLFGPWT